MKLPWDNRKNDFTFIYHNFKGQNIEDDTISTLQKGTVYKNLNGIWRILTVIFFLYIFYQK